MEAMTATEDHVAEMLEVETAATALAAGSGFRDPSEPRLHQRRAGSVGEEAMVEAAIAAADAALDAPPAADAP